MRYSPDGGSGEADLEAVIRRILAARPELSREQVLEMIKERTSRLGQTVSMLSAALNLARELGVEIDMKFELGTPVKGLVSGLRDVTVTGRVMRLWPVRRFRKRDGSVGKMASFILADSTGSIRVVLWDDKADIVEEGWLEIGKLVRVSHGYTREGLGGRVELHVGPMGSVEVNPPGVDEEDYPSPFPEPTEIASIGPEADRVSVEGFISAMRPATSFTRPDGSPGKVLRLRISDETGSITCVLWNEAAEACEGLEIGSRLRLLGARVRESLTGQLELHVERDVQVEVLPGRVEVPLGGLVKVADMKPGLSGVEAVVKVLRAGKPRELRTGQVATLVVGDETGTIRLDLWDDKAELARQIRPGDILLVRNAYVRERRGARILNVGKLGSVELNPEGLDIEAPVRTEEEITPLVSIEEPGGPYTVEVMLETAPELREVITGRGEAVQVASVQVSDDTGIMRLSLWRDLAEQVATLPPGTRIRVHQVYAREGPFGLELSTSVGSFLEVVKSESEEER